MSDDRIIDFNELKNKVKDSDVDKFEQYIYTLYNSVMSGSMSMVEFSKKIMEYMNENNISQEKFINIQKKFMERYGMDSSEIDDQLKNLGIDPKNIDLSNMDNINFEEIKKSIGFYEKYNYKIKPKASVETYIKNDHNDIKIIFDQEQVTLISQGKINLVDAELNELLLSYKNSLDKTINITMCENITEYDY
ncbi:DUF3867 domain-containing protein [Paraclostridium bifermentans]